MAIRSRGCVRNSVILSVGVILSAAKDLAPASHSDLGKIVRFAQDDGTRQDDHIIDPQLYAPKLTPRAWTLR